MKNDELLHKFGRTYGKLIFDPDNKNLIDSMKKCTNEILRRIDANKIDLKSLEQLLTDEDVVLNGNLQTEVIEKLLSQVSYKLLDCASEAKIIYCMDISGSMGAFERFMARSFALWNEKLLQENYYDIQKLYVAHHIEAEQIYTEDEFFNVKEKGGTIVSSGLNKVNEIINSYNYYNQDTYVFIMSDGDNLTSNNDMCVRILDDIQRKVKHTCYFEINPYNRSTTLMSALRHVNYVNFTKHILRNKDDMLPEIKKYWEALMS
jgi:hypothetical protein